MTEIDRVKKMVVDGLITAEEGEQLIRVLRETEPAAQEVGSEGVRSHAATSIGDAGVAVVEPETRVRPTATTARTRRWVRFEMLAGDLDVYVDGSLQAPVVRSTRDIEAVIEQADYGFLVKWEQLGQGLRGLLHQGAEASKVKLILPEGFGLDLRGTAGDVDLRGVPYLRGHLIAGDVDAKGLKGVDFTCRAGDVELELELTDGTHSLTVTVGDAELELGPNSSVQIVGEVVIGDIRSELPGVVPSGRGAGARLEGTVGAGAATLDVRVTTGNLELEVADE